MGLINLIQYGWEWNKDKNSFEVDISHKGLTITKTFSKELKLSKRRRRSSYSEENTCLICKKKCAFSFGNRYQQICIDCADEWLNNSINELDNIKKLLQNNKEHIINNKDKLVKKEKELLDKWNKLDILEKLEEKK